MHNRATYPNSGHICWNSTWSIWHWWLVSQLIFFNIVYQTVYLCSSITVIWGTSIQYFITCLHAATAMLQWNFIATVAVRLSEYQMVPILYTNSLVLVKVYRTLSMFVCRDASTVALIMYMQLLDIYWKWSHLGIYSSNVCHYNGKNYCAI